MLLNEEFFRQRDLIVKHLKGELSESEKQEFEAWLRHREVADNTPREEWMRRLERMARSRDTTDLFSGLNSERAWARIASQISEEAPRSQWRTLSTYWRRVAAAALFLGITGYAAYRYTYKGDRIPHGMVDRVQDVQPGGTRATLTLEDGSVVALETLANGKVAAQKGATVTKEDSWLLYNGEGHSARSETVFHTVTTPVSGQFNLVLPDGSRVWLNSASSLRFPTVFAGGERRVELTGEAYFEVKTTRESGTKTPFRVKTGRGEVEVLGTHFNVAAYADEQAQKTTLLEGAVKISDGKVSKVLAPGQQAVITHGIRVDEVDTEEAVAWKNGNFQFERTELKEILQQLRRWYGVDVANEREIPHTHFTAVISRNLTLRHVLKMLELSGELKFELKNNKIEVRENKSNRENAAAPKEVRDRPDPV